MIALLGSDSIVAAVVHRREARSADRTHQVYVNALKRSSDTFIRLTDHYTIPRR